MNGTPWRCKFPISFVQKNDENWLTVIAIKNGAVFGPILHILRLDMSLSVFRRPTRLKTFFLMT